MLQRLYTDEISIALQSANIGFCHQGLVRLLTSNIIYPWRITTDITIYYALRKLLLKCVLFLYLITTESFKDIRHVSTTVNTRRHFCFKVKLLFYCSNFFRPSIAGRGVGIKSKAHGRSAKPIFRCS